MVAALVVSYVLAAALPAAGLARLLLRVRRRLARWDALVVQRGHAQPSYDDVRAFFGADVREHDREERRDLLWDVALIGGGLLLGSAASIASLFL